MVALELFLVFILIIIAGFFVAIEFAIVNLKMSKVEQLISEGNKKAKSVKIMKDNLDSYLSACQLGITVTVLGLGWLGGPVVDNVLHSIFEYFRLSEKFSSIISFILSFSIITFFYIVFGKLIPKVVAINKTESVSSHLAGFIIVFYKVSHPFILLLNGFANLFIKILGLKQIKKHEDAHTEEELRIILLQSYQSGKINKSEFDYVDRVFQFDERISHEIMTPRTDMKCLYIENTLEQNLKIIQEEQFTRFPIISKDKDNIMGVINTKEFFFEYLKNPEIRIEELIRPVLFIPSSTPIKKLLKQMQRESTHMVILSDEYSGTAGLITIEDILEEIVGAIRDEFDEEEKPEIDKINNHTYIVDGIVFPEEIERIFKVSLNANDFDSIGGWLVDKNNKIKKGEKYSFKNLIFTVRERKKHRITKIEIKQHKSNISNLF